MLTYQLPGNAKSTWLVGRRIWPVSCSYPVAEWMAQPNRTTPRNWRLSSADSCGNYTDPLHGARPPDWTRPGSPSVLSMVSPMVCQHADYAHSPYAYPAYERQPHKPTHTWNPFAFAKRPGQQPEPSWRWTQNSPPPQESSKHDYVFRSIVGRLNAAPNLSAVDCRQRQTRCPQIKLAVWTRLN